jgi:hypothetical protein
LSRASPTVVRARRRVAPDRAHLLAHAAGERRRGPGERVDHAPLRRVERAHLPARQRAEPHRPEPHARQPLDDEVERLADAPHLPRAPLGDRQLELPASIAERLRGHGRCLDRAIVEREAVASVRTAAGALPRTTAT